MSRDKKVPEWVPDIKLNHLVYKALMRPGYRSDGHWMSDELIETAKTKAFYSSKTPHHEHNDCIRAAYEWFEAQEILKGTSPKKLPVELDVIIENWAKLPISISDIEVVVAIHPALRVLGGYPNYNISTNLVEPSFHRLDPLYSPPHFKPRRLPWWFYYKRCDAYRYGRIRRKPPR